MLSKLMMASVLAISIGYFLFAKGDKVSSSEARSLVDAGAQLVDVRTPEEFAAGHISGAINIPVQDLERRMGELNAKDGGIVVYCRSGARSSRAAAMLKDSGYTQVHNMGSMSSW